MSRDKRKVNENQRLYEEIKNKGYCFRGITSEQFRSIMQIAETKSTFDERYELAYLFIKAHSDGLEKCCYENSPEY